jgi:hypothetical protein
MDFKLLNNIVSHIFANFAIVESDFVNLQKTKSLASKDYLVDKRLSFSSDDGSQLIENKVWGCQFSVETHELKVLLGDCSITKEDKEYCMIVKKKDCPVYGLYITSDYNSILSISLNGVDWMECSTYLQATFLAGMEQVKEVCLNWNRITSFDEEYNMMVNFIKYANCILESR